MKRLLWTALLLCVPLAAQQAPIPMAGELPGHPFAIRHTWVIGGVGDWDYLTVDAAARQLFIAHGPVVQVVSLDSGSVVATIRGFRDAHQIVLDHEGQFGYVTDGGANTVRVFDRTNYELVASIPTGPQPRSLVLDPSTGLLLAICAAPASYSQPDVRTASGRHASRRSYIPVRPPDYSGPVSTLTLMDPQKRAQLVEIFVRGKLGFAQADGTGRIYVSDEDGNTIQRLDLQAIQIEVGKIREADAELARKENRPIPELTRVDWTGDPFRNVLNRPPQDVVPFTIRVGSECQSPHGIALDAQNNRVFVACANQKAVVLDSQRGRILTSLTIGPGADAIAYDASRGLIFTANGGGYGSVSIIRQHVTDTYSVIQTLPTLQQARTIAVDPTTGLVYVVTTLYGAKLGNPPMNGIGKLKIDPVGGSFQVLVIGNS